MKFFFIALILLSTILGTTASACSTTGQSCFSSNDCCEKLYCIGGSAGQPHYCRRIGEKITSSTAPKTKSLSSSCEQKCYDKRAECINRNGNSHSCEDAYDSCKAGCN